MRVVSNNYITRDSIVDGEGVRDVIFFQGCPHNCEGCHNPSTHDFNQGVLKSVDEIYKDILSEGFFKNVTFSGGDPMCQAKELTVLCRRLKESGYNIWVYTGYTLENLTSVQRGVLPYIDVLVDGKFIKDKKSMELSFRGSANQRLINVPVYLSTGEKILLY